MIENILIMIMIIKVFCIIPHMLMDGGILENPIRGITDVNQ